MAVDFVLRNALVAGHSGPVAIAVAAGRIAAVSADRDPGPDIPSEDAGGRFVCAGLVETHIHLDKAGIMGRCRLCAGTLAEAVAETARAKAAFTVEDVHARATAVVAKAVLAGTTRLRTFVEIDPRAGFRSFEAVKAVRRDFAGILDIEICAFAQEGLTQEPDTEAMLDAALEDGADLVGGCPYTDPDPAAHIRRVFDLAARHGVAVDFHLDFDLDPAGPNLPTVIAETRARGYAGRVSVGHVTKLSALPPDAFEAAGRAMAEAGVAVTVLPATDLYLTGRSATHLVPRGVTPAHRLAALGVTATVATNNVLNPFTPYGDASLVRMANLYATVAQVGTEEGLAAVFGMVTDAAARLLGHRDYGLAPGNPADLVLLDAASPAEAVAVIAQPLAVWKRGVKTVDRPPARILLR
ncbi:amidohydrolase family protein [Chthonobacter rhizosphaerae]|uniref:amidohydrolase family protein n=1 Tax=Chthonobacter rhizosphaerae TaxID=2735553 RepID=UPI0015EF3A9F|nr:amidohydrolase family protein [Chthonobacter rhizosphaerae]